MNNRTNFSRRLVFTCLLAALLLVLSACGTNNAQQPNEPASDNASQGNTAQPENPVSEDTATTHTVTDWTGHTITIPVQPERVIYFGETTGDLLALGVTPIGISNIMIEGTTYESQVAQAADIGFPFNVEAALALQPDLIIFGNSDEAQYEQIAKVGSTATFNTFAPLEERMATLGELLGKQQEAVAWLEQYNEQLAGMWAHLRSQGLKDGETATVFTMYPGNRLFVMAGAGLPQFLYDKDGFSPTEPVAGLIADEIGFAEISAETAIDYAGDRIFILNAVAEEAQQSTRDLMDSAVWQSIPAVKNGYVYSVDIQKAGSDATSREWLIEQLPAIMNMQ